MPSSYPIPYTRTNLGPAGMKKLPFFSDSTGFNPSDPSSLQTQGQTRNGIYNPQFASLPDGSKMVKSKKPADWKNDGGPLNKCFYSFGSRTNIKRAMMLQEE